MTIDWSKAPEGFPLWLEGTNDEHRKHSGWYRDAGLVFEGADGGQWRACREGQFFNIHRKPEPAAWNGEGLPPVGAIVEVRYAIEDHKSDWPWHEGECVVVGASPEGDEFCVVRAGNVIACFSGRRTHIRPFRTPEQIAAEERREGIKGIQSASCGQCGPSICEQAAAALYDAGYRKQVAL